MELYKIILHLFAFTGIVFAIYQTIGVIKLKIKQKKKVREFDNMCKNVLNTLEKFNIKIH